MQYSTRWDGRPAGANYRYARKTGVIADAERFARENRLGLWHAGGVV
jgi:hypothetical protein